MFCTMGLLLLTKCGGDADWEDCGGGGNSEDNSSSFFGRGGGAGGVFDRYSLRGSMAGGISVVKKSQFFMFYVVFFT